MHDAAYRAVQRAVRRHELNQPDHDVVEIGAYYVNGSVRPLFGECRSYTGIDVRPGPGVDVTHSGATYEPAEPVDVVVTTEVLEHARNWRDIVGNAAAMLKPGGALVITAAGPGRAPHGNDGGNVGSEFYANIDPLDLTAALDEAGFIDAEVEHNTTDHDVYAVAFRPKGKRR